MNKRKRKKRATKAIIRALKGKDPTKSTYPWWQPQTITTDHLDFEQVKILLGIIEDIGRPRLTVPEEGGGGI